MKHTNFISGEEYNLRELFGGKAKIVIPDLQRDYCWGLETYDRDKKAQGELVTQFINGLMEEYKSEHNDFMSLGLLYGYESPKGQIQLCDGQQRLTTLFLLLGVLNRMASSQELEPLLMSNFEQADDQEPQLLYAIRESTLYFLSDLTYHYFLNKNKLSIKEAEWYYSEYEQDASIQAIIGAVHTIEVLLDKFNKDLKDFSYFIINNLRFVYFDMSDRQHGEETFVVINTTGEPLTATENLKPILIGNISESNRKQRSDEWEEREEWFWKHRDKENEYTSDGLSSNFYTWYWQIQLLQERMWKNGKASDINPRDLFLKRMDNGGNNVEEYDSTNRWNGDLTNVHIRFQALVTLFQTLEKSKNLHEIISALQSFVEKNYSDIFIWLRKNANIDVLLPLISFCEKFRNDPAFTEGIIRFARRIAKNHLDKIFKRTRRNNTETYLDWRYIIQIIEQAGNINELMTFNSLQENVFHKQIPNVRPACWYDFDEQMKDKYTAAGLDIVACEMHSCLRFDLSVLWENGYLSAEEIKKRYENICSLCNCLTPEKEISSELANLYRFYRFIMGWGDRIGHVSYRTWEAEGCIYNLHSYAAAYVHEFKDMQFSQLLSEDNMTEALYCAIANKFTKEDFYLSENSTTSQYLKLWMLLKTLAANKRREKIDYWNGMAIGCYINMLDNRINNQCTFSIINSCPGYLKRDSIASVEECNYSNSLFLDTPLYISSNSKDIENVAYNDFKNKQVPESVLKNVEAIMHDMFTEFLKQYQTSHY